MSLQVLLGYDGSLAASAAIDVGAQLFPGAHGRVIHRWGPPYASDAIRGRIRQGARDIDGVIELVESEGEREAHRIARMGVVLARAEGWDVEPWVERTWSSEASRITEAAQEMNADVVIIGSRGLSGTQAFLGSVSDLVVHQSHRPVLVVPYPMFAAEFDALPHGPVVVGWDGSAGSQAALAAARRLLPDRRFMAVSVGESAEPAGPPDEDVVTHLTVERRHGLGKRSIAGCVLDTATEQGAAVVVVGSRGQSAAREILLGSVAKGTLHHSHRPVLVVPNR